ncbi:LCCL domain-containing protein [Decorospora gaudefroyi]|uniref:LCCL domain-containing protein n=1 Tax=Decorospora gaudefroyi TaxID=184978 RepID=A0A6A5KCH3_9PLEO|nr:LCCL domain-containing protein [Decorospora gaudefroyi]
MRNSLQYRGTDGPIDDEAYGDTTMTGTPPSTDEEAQLLREELDFEDNTPHTRSHGPKSGLERSINFLRGPEPPRVQYLRPYFPSVQRRLIDCFEARGFNKPVSVVIVLLLWFFMFVWFLSAQLPIQDGDGNSVLNLDCVDTLWKRKNECGIDGIDCRPFGNQTFAFRCPAKCGDVQILNPHIVGPLEVNYRPLVIGTGRYRGDSFICGSAIHAGIVDNRRGGGGRVNLIGTHDNFASTKHHGIESIPFDSYFPLSFSVVFDDSFQSNSNPRSALLAVSLLVTAALAIFSTSPAIFFPIFALIFAHVSFVSDPPSASYRNVTVLPDHISMFAKRLLPALFVAVVLYSTTIKRTLSDLTAQIEKALFWLGGFWIGALSNYTFDWIPISRLTAHDLEQQPGAKLALAIIVLMLVAIIVGQVYYFWLEGRLIRYLGLYGLLVFGIIVCLAIPGVNLRIHHYILALLLLPGTSLQTRPSLLYQGVLLGLFVNGIARWDFDSVLQTSDALRADARLESVVPHVLEPAVDVAAEVLVATFTYGAHPVDVDGISVLVNDVERDRAFYDEVDGTWTPFKWTRSVDTDLNEYFRWAYVRHGRTLDYSKPGALYSNGTWGSGSLS